MEAETEVRDVVELSLTPLRRRKSVKIECFVIDEITSFANIDIQEDKQTYSYSRGIFFSNFCITQELPVDILIVWNYSDIIDKHDSLLSWMTISDCGKI